MLFILLTYSSVAWSIELSQGYGKAKWGMSVEELSKVVDITDVVMLGKPYAEHFEWKPDVYVSYLPPDWRKIEYYFYKNKLYKIFIIYSLSKSNFSNPLKYYEHIVNEEIKTFGKPLASYEDDRFGFLVWHNIWEDNITQLDLRLGSRFIRKVIIYKSLANEKNLKFEKKMLYQDKKEIPNTINLIPPDVALQNNSIFF